MKLPFRFGILAGTLSACFLASSGPTTTAAAPPPPAPAKARHAAPVTKYARLGYSDWSIPERYAGKVVSSRAKGFSEKVVALTFDDGPDPKVTPRVLKALAQYGAKATFFMIGQCAKTYPKLVKQVAAAGHTVGSHSYTHPAYPDKSRAHVEIDKTAKVLKKELGVAPTIYRPTYGITKNWLTKVATQEGYPAVTWTVSSADTATKKAADIYNNVDGGVRPGSVVLMHDGTGHKLTADALPTILAYLKKAGYTCVTVPDLLRRWDQYYAVQAAIAKQKRSLKKSAVQRKSR